MGKEKGSGVEVHSVLTVVSSTPVKPGRTCPLSPLDHAMAHDGLHVIFYYRSSSLHFDRIRPALNEVLSLYPNVTGRLSKDDHGNWEIKCNDAGVRVFLAKANTSVDEWLRSACGDDEVHLTAKEDLPDDPSYWSPYRIQITEFEGGGTAIALSCLHMLADPTTLTLFIKSWTEAHLDKPIAHQPFLHPFAFHNSSATATATTTATTTAATTATNFYAAKSKLASNPHPSLRMASATFSFSDSIIKKTLSEINSDASPFDLLTALFWTRITRLKRTTAISICTDLRKRLAAPLPYGYFGNAFHFSQLTVDPTDLDGGDLRHVSDLVHRHVSGLKEEEFWSGIDWFRSRKGNQIQGKFDSPFRMYGPELTCVNMEHMIAPVGTHSNESQPLMYMARFEKDQKPAHVSYMVGNAEGEGLILVMPSPEEGLLARRVAVTLPEEEMEKLLQDKIILSLEPNLLLSGPR